MPTFGSTPNMPVRNDDQTDHYRPRWNEPSRRDLATAIIQLSPDVKPIL